MNFQPASWDSGVWSWTAGVLCVLGGLLLFTFLRGRTAASSAPTVILFFVTLLSLAFAPKGFEVPDHTLKVRLWCASLRYDLNTLIEAKPMVAEEFSGIRVFAVGGVFGYNGIFRNNTLGRYRAFVTNRRKLVLLRFFDKTVVISPSDQLQFLRQIPATQKAAGK